MDHSSQNYDSSTMGYDSGGGISVNTGFGGSEGGGTLSGSYASGSGSNTNQKTSFFSNSSQVKFTFFFTFSYYLP